MAGMEAYAQRSARARPRHRYSLPEFGLTEGAVLEQLGDYIRRFDVSVPGRRPAVPGTSSR